jgi:hypothetical protein
MEQLRELMEEAVAALTALDASALEKIRSQAQSVAVVPLSSAETAMLLPVHRLFGALLQETERNLKLFRLSSHAAQQDSDTGCYAFPV